MLAGCAGWTLTCETLAAFPPEGSHLERYACVFGAVEINSSFYRSHQAKTWQRWGQCVPADFRFSVKIPRTITHDAKLVGIDRHRTRRCTSLPMKLKRWGTSWAACWCSCRPSWPLIRR